MDQQQQHQQQPQPGGVPGPTGRRLHIAHRRSPSELTPLMMEQLAIQQQIELLQQQQQQLQATYQQFNMVPGQTLGAGGYNPLQSAMPNMSPQPGYQFPTQLPPAGTLSLAPSDPTHCHIGR
ncbi:predicted protein [Chaetomium globosum CBS 148.51]|uniref:Uncharacterized protein n=1 Tax=Chaetomium globosum (strain ATCC 6205 / CBS 148.51 / DSM 1962 / NBRC 6347 / NRRL 1970) TaxID=306901 RepID=Q2GWE5_CHAGB|nr:uncharacterized protein CHGG_07709 [Chaetomium globosum CBS 148.51]EAQ86456.1 predicted protein [Chaetomium globosum CBS 148.51]